MRALPSLFSALALLGGVLTAQPENAAPSSAISTRTLSHKPSRAAQKEFNRGVSAFKKHRDEEAYEYFTAAVLLDPDYAEAQTMLGNARANRGEFEQALECFFRAVRLEPNVSGFQANVAWILLNLQRAGDAEPFARRAVQLSPSYVEAHYVLGLTLAAQQRFTPEASASLRIAGRKHPYAREVLALVELRLKGKR